MSAKLHKRGVFEKAQEKSSPPAPYALGVIHTTFFSATKHAPGTINSTPLHNGLTRAWSCRTGSQYVWTGRERRVSLLGDTMTDISAWAVGPHLMELRSALKQRSLKAETPYHADSWKTYLCAAGLLEWYVEVPEGLHRGFQFGFPSIH